MYGDLETLTTPRRRRARARLLAVLASFALILTACGGDDGDATATTEAPTTTAPPTTEAEPEVEPNYVATPIAEGEIEFRAAPEDDAEVTNVLPNPRPIDADPPVPVPLHMLVDEMNDEWVEVLLPVRPNGTTGWIRRDEVELASHPYRIEALLDEFTLVVYENDEVIFETEVGVARENAPTPGGLYYTTELIRPTDPEGPYGSYAYGMSGFSEEFETFNGGEGQLGIHGTDEPELIGEAVSAGCIRLTNEDIEFIVEDLELPLGVPVEIISDHPTGDDAEDVPAEDLPGGEPAGA